MGIPTLHLGARPATPGLLLPQPWRPRRSAPLRTARPRLPAPVRASNGTSPESSSPSSVPTATDSKPMLPAVPTRLSRTPQPEGPSTDLSVIFSRLGALAAPYWTEGDQAAAARWRLAGVLALTLATTGVSVVFSFLGRDFFNALSAKDQAKFTEMLGKWLIAITCGIPVFVLRDYYQSRLALEWREWMTNRLTNDYFAEQTFYRVQAGALLDNPDQRIAVDVRTFTDSTLSFTVTLLNAAVDLVSFSGILFTIYPPLFAALVVYSVGGTAASLVVGRPLVGLNFAQEAAEANFRYGLVRVRENAESIAFYGGEDNEARLLGRRLAAAVANYGQLLMASRNLNFFTSFYRFLIQILPAAVVAPLFFRGEIEFGVVNQSSSAFNHILTDVSLVVYQFEALAGFSAVVDRLGELTEVLDGCKRSGGSSSEKGAAEGVDVTETPHQSDDTDSSSTPPALTPVSSALATSSSADGDADGDGASAAATPSLTSSVEDAMNGVRGRGVELIYAAPAPGGPLMTLDHLSLQVPTSGALLIKNLSLEVDPGHSLLIMGPSGSGKTSLLRTVAGLWRAGAGCVTLHGTPMGRAEGEGEVFFVPQRPYVVLGTLREQLLYPTWARPEGTEAAAEEKGGKTAATVAKTSSHNARLLPTDDEMRAALRSVRLGPLLDRVGGDLDAAADWAAVLSLGEQQRIAFARVVLSKPSLVLMDESTSALDTANEAALYQALAAAGVTYVSVGHRPTLLRFHERVLLLHGDGVGGWEVRPASEVNLETAVAFMD